MEEFNNDDDKISEPEDFFLSDAEEVLPPSVTIPLSIDYNARVVTQSAKCDAEGDNCNMHFVEKSSFSGRRGSESGLHTSTEDLNVSDEEQSCNSLTLQAVNLDGLVSASKTDENSLSTLNYSHTIFKDECNADSEYLSDKISSNIGEKIVNEGKHVRLRPVHKTNELPCIIKTASSVAHRTKKKILNSSNTKSIFSDSLLLDENISHDLYDEQESPSMTCLEFLKSDISDEHNTDTEDISVGSVDDIIELSSCKNPSGKDYNALNAPLLLSECYAGNVIDNRHIHPSGSRRSSAVEFNTDDEIFSLDSFCDRVKKRVKKRSFILVDKNEKSDDFLTDEEVIEDQ